MKFVFPFLALVVGAHAQAVDMTPVNKWVEHTAKLKTFSANFTQQRFLRTVRKPLESQGTIAFAAPGSVRWEARGQVNMIATVKAGGDLTIQHPNKEHPEEQKAEVITRAMLQEKGDGQGLALLESGFPQSMAEFQKKFDVTKVEKQGDFWQVDAKLIGGASKAVTKVVFQIQDGAFTLSGLQFHFRDTSRVESRFTTFIENPKLPKDCFVPDLTGYKLK
jgi:outer membrane lipoprotein-sorting protein